MRTSARCGAGRRRGLLRRTLRVLGVDMVLVIGSAQRMATPRDFSSPPSAIVGHAVMPLDATMEQNPGSEGDYSVLVETASERAAPTGLMETFQALTKMIMDIRRRLGILRPATISGRGLSMMARRPQVPASRRPQCASSVSIAKDKAKSRYERYDRP
jgi:hypothetical protein